VPAPWAEIDRWWRAEAGGKRPGPCRRLEAGARPVTRRNGPAPDPTGPASERLHGYETSVRFLKDESGRGAPASHCLQLFYARTLVDYAHAYSWEIRQRERVESGTAVDLGPGTLDQIAGRRSARTRRSGSSVRRSARCRWAGSRVPAGGQLSENVRGTLRDAVSYLLVELLADSSLWRPEQANEVFRSTFPRCWRERRKRRA